MISLRKFQINDITPKYIRWLSNKKITKFTTIKKPTKIEIIKYVKFNIKNKKISFLKIILKKKIHIGNVRIFYYKKKATIGILIGETNFLNKGYGSKALKIAIKKIEKKKINLIYAYIHKKNIQSIKLFKKNNFIKSKKNNELYFLKIK